MSTTYDALGRLATVSTAAVPAAVFTYPYDGVSSRVLTETDPDGDPVPCTLKALQKNELRDNPASMVALAAVSSSRKYS